MPLTSFDAVLQSRPGRLDFLELAETVSAEPLDRNIVVGSARLYSELPVEHRQDSAIGAARLNVR